MAGTVGCVLSNELLDAMPVHQVTVEGGELRELYVALNTDSLVIESGAPSTPLLSERLNNLGIRLAEGQVAEVNLGLDQWLANAAAALERGFVLTIDYGRTAEDLYSATQRFRGTLTTLRNHMQTDRPLDRIGRQDMSAQVDFTSLAKAGTEDGLDMLGYASQAEFLGNLAVDQFMQRPPAGLRREARSARVGPAGAGQARRAGRFQSDGTRQERGAARTVGLS